MQSLPKTRIFKFQLVLFAMLFTLPAQAFVLVGDAFNDNQLDSAWTVTYENAHSWDYLENDSLLSVYDIEYDQSQVWTVVNLQRDLSYVREFQLEFDLAWDSEEVNQSMQSLLVELNGADGLPLIRAGYNDAWVSHRGGYFGWFRDAGSHATVHNSLPHSGAATVRIVQEGGAVSLYWNENLLISGYQEVGVASLNLRFSWYPYPNAFLGTLMADRLEFTVLGEDPQLGIQCEDGSLRLEWACFPAVTYNVWSSEAPDTLFPDEWTLETLEPISDCFWQQTYNQSQRFYRVTMITP